MYGWVSVKILCCEFHQGGGGHTPVDSSVVVVTVEELDLLEGLLAGVVAGQVRVHTQEEIEGRRTCAGFGGGNARGQKVKVFSCFFPHPLTRPADFTH